MKETEVFSKDHLILSYNQPLGRQRLCLNEYIEDDMEKVKLDLQWRIATIN